MEPGTNYFNQIKHFQLTRGFYYSRPKYFIGYSNRAVFKSLDFEFQVDWSLHFAGVGSSDWASRRAMRRLRFRTDRFAIDSCNSFSAAINVDFASRDCLSGQGLGPFGLQFGLIAAGSGPRAFGFGVAGSLLVSFGSPCCQGHRTCRLAPNSVGLVAGCSSRLGSGSAACTRLG